MSKNIILKTIDEVDFFIKRIGREVSRKRKFTYFILTNEPLFEIDKLKTFLIENSLNDFSKNEISNLVSICVKLLSFNEAYKKIPLVDTYDYFYEDLINGKEIRINGGYEAKYFVISETKILPIFDEPKFKELFQKDYDCFVLHYFELKTICKNVIELLEPAQNDEPYKNEDWFIVGLLFANGEMDKLSKQFDGNASKIARHLNRENLRPCISDSKGGNKNAKKNLFNSRDKMQKIIEHCESNRIAVQPSFSDRLPTE